MKSQLAVLLLTYLASSASLAIFSNFDTIFFKDLPTIYTLGDVYIYFLTSEMLCGLVEFS
jgi:hypothetical protein